MDRSPSQISSADRVGLQRPPRHKRYEIDCQRHPHDTCGSYESPRHTEEVPMSTTGFIETVLICLAGVSSLVATGISLLGARQDMAHLVGLDSAAVLLFLAA